MGLNLAITSGKGGVGKSTVAIGLANAFCKMGEKVLLVDMDEGLRCLDLMLGVDGETVFDLSDVVEKGNVESALYNVEYISGLSLIPAPQQLGKLDFNKFKTFANSLGDKFTVVIFDFAAGIDFNLYTALPTDTVFLTVASQDPVSVRDAGVVSKSLNDNNLATRLVVNNFKYSHLKTKVYGSIDNLIDAACLQLVGIVPQSDELRYYSIKRKIKKNGKANKAFVRIANRLKGNMLPIPKPKSI